MPTKAELLGYAEMVLSCTCTEDGKDRPDCPRTTLIKISLLLRKLADEQEEAAEVETPRKSELESLAGNLSASPCTMRVERRTVDLNRAAEILLARRDLYPIRLEADEVPAETKEAVPEEAPKVESLREAWIRLARQKDNEHDIPDLCAIVLRRHLQLLDLLLHEQRRLGGDEWARSELQRMRDEADQMLEGSGE